MSSPYERQMDPQPETMRIRWGLWIFLGIALTLFLVFIAWRVVLSSGTNTRLDALRKAGYATSMAELQQKYYGPVADEKNAALSYLDAFSQLHEPKTKAMGHFWNERLSMQAALADNSDRQAFTDALQANRALLDQLRQVPDGLSSRYPLNFSQGFNMLLPHLSQIKGAEQILMLDSVMSAEAKNSAQTMDDFRAGIRLAKSLDDEPLLISQLVRISCRNIIFSSLERALTSGSFTDAQLKELADIFAREENPQTMERALSGELCCGIFAFQMVSGANQSGQNNLTGTQGALAGTLMNITGITSRDCNYYVDVMTQYLTVSKMEFPKSLKASDDVQKNVARNSGRLHIISDMLLPSLSKQTDKAATDAARVRIMQTALALERYRLAHQNHLPEKLENLAPTFLPAVLTDPFDGQPLRYQQLAKGYRVYSIGPDRRDDGGAERNPKNTSAPTDITFTVER